LRAAQGYYAKADDPAEAECSAADQAIAAPELRRQQSSTATIPAGHRRGSFYLGLEPLKTRSGLVQISQKDTRERAGAVKR